MIGIIKSQTDWYNDKSVQIRSIQNSIRKESGDCVLKKSTCPPVDSFERILKGIQTLGQAMRRCYE